jgi:molybdopterin-binding protein
MKISARNYLEGKIKKLVPGAVNTEVTVELPGGAAVVSIITKESADRLNRASRRQESLCCDQIK